MTVIILVSASASLRGHVNRWMIEVNPGVFVGRINRRIRDKLWETISQRINEGQAIIITNSPEDEQGWKCQTSGRDRWIPTDFEGLTLFKRPN